MTDQPGTHKCPMCQQPAISVRGRWQHANANDLSFCMAEFGIVLDEDDEQADHD